MVAPPSVGASLESSYHRYGEGLLGVCFDCSQVSGTLVSERGACKVPPMARA